MNIASIQTAPHSAAAQQPPPADQPHDGDSDDKAPVQAALPAGVGTKVDIQA